MFTPLIYVWESISVRMDPVVEQPMNVLRFNVLSLHLIVVPMVNAFIL